MDKVITPYEHNGDTELLKELGLPIWEAKTWQETYIGEVIISDSKDYPEWIKIWVTCAPAQFYRFEIKTEGGQVITIETGSGGLSRYYPMALEVAQGMFVPKSITSSQEEKNKYI